MSVNSVDDLYGIYWSHRNVDLSYILYDWQYRAFIDAPYFYRPLRWDGGYWRFGVYARYPSVTTTISDDQRSITFTMAHIAGV